MLEINCSSGANLSSFRRRTAEGRFLKMFETASVSKRYIATRRFRPSCPNGVVDGVRYLLESLPLPDRGLQSLRFFMLLEKVEIFQTDKSGDRSVPLGDDNPAVGKSASVDEFRKAFFGVGDRCFDHLHGKLL